MRVTNLTEISMKSERIGKTGNGDRRSRRQLVF
jgi:hypothetical protein